MASERMSDVDQAAYRVCEAASDYKLGHQSPEFRDLNGGLAGLREKLFTAAIQWEWEMTANDGEVNGQ